MAYAKDLNFFFVNLVYGDVGPRVENYLSCAFDLASASPFRHWR